MNYSARKSLQSATPDCCHSLYGLFISSFSLFNFSWLMFAAESVNKQQLTQLMRWIKVQRSVTRTHCKAFICHFARWIHKRRASGSQAGRWRSQSLCTFSITVGCFNEAADAVARCKRAKHQRWVWITHSCAVVVKLSACRPSSEFLTRCRRRRWRQIHSHFLKCLHFIGLFIHLSMYWFIYSLSLQNLV